MVQMVWLSRIVSRTNASTDPQMKFPAFLIFTLFALFIFFVMSGCGCLIIYDTKSGNVAAVKFDLLQDVQVGRYATTERGTTIEKGSSVVNDQAVQAITAGVVEGVLKGVKP